MASAARCYADGQLLPAALLCAAILKTQPRHCGAINLLAVVLCRLGHLPEGVALLRGALAIRPDDAPTLDRLGDALYAQGDHDGAIAAYEQAIGRDPGFVAAWCKIGIALNDLGRTRDAMATYRRAIVANPQAPKPYFNLAILLRRDRRLVEAAACYARAIALKPDYPEAFLNLGNVLMDMGRFADAALAYARAAGADPAEPASALAACDGDLPAAAAEPPAGPSPAFRAHAWTNLGIALKKQGRLDAAFDAHGRAIALAPDYAIAHNNLGVLLQDRGRIAEAMAAHRRAIALDPGFGTAHSNLGVALKEAGLIREAIAAHRCAVAAEPDHPKFHFNLAAALLMAGDFEEGFSEYEWRWRGGVPDLKDRNFAQPRWDGGDLAGRTLLLHAEQGFGDTLQFIRYAAQVAGRGGPVVCEVPGALAGLVRMAGGLATVVAAGEPLPAFDVHLPLMSLPHVLATRLQTVPARVPYLRPDPALAAAWQQRLDIGRDLKVGVVWAGNPRHSHDHQRSIAAAALLPALAMTGAQLYSLQKEPRRGDRAVIAGLAGDLTDLSGELHDFNDTAAAVTALDLVITVDTSVAHLAGALGRPVWTLLPFALDWRWLLGRDDSPWYPTMRLFRQPRPGDWTSVLARVQVELTKLVMTSRDRSRMRASA